MLYPEPSSARQVAAYILAVPAAFGVATAMHYLLAPLRQRGAISRFVARVGIIGVFYTTFAAVMVGIAGPYVFAGRTRDGGWITSPTTGRGILGMGFALGVLGALLWPVASRAKGDDLEM